MLIVLIGAVLIFGYTLVHATLYAPDGVPVPPPRAFGQDVATSSLSSRLNLITCDGTWVHGQDTYDERLVVYTKYVG